jgi:hypothetical protein
MTQTAVDWLFKTLWEEPKDKMVWYAILDKARDINREQIIKAFLDGLEWPEVSKNEGKVSANFYYRDTYGG